jgi:TolA-binding protein
MMNQLMRIAMATCILAYSAPALAQASDAQLRIEKLEKEVRALQRKIFPPKDGSFFEPEITAASPAPTSGSSSSIASDLIARVDAIERQLASLTGQVEQNGFRLKKLEDQMAAASAANAASSSAPTANISTQSAQAVTEPKPVQTAAVTPAPQKPTASTARRDAVAAIVWPETGDKGEDSYIYGYRLWEAKFYPEAATQLKETVAKYPNHARASHAQNLLGRAYLDDGKPALASVALYENYQKRPRGERAPDSLYFLGVALTELKKLDEACKAFDELVDVYPESATGRLASRLQSARAAAKCK